MTTANADRAKAAELCLDMPPGIDAHDIYNTAPFREQVEFVAAALAAERAAAVERITTDVRALAEEIEGWNGTTAARHGGIGLREYAVARLRAVVADTGKPDTSSEEE